MQMQDNTMFEKRLAEIQAMPDGPEKQEALRQLSLDYPGRLADLQRQEEHYGEMAGKAMPQGTLAGPSSNPFTRYVGAGPVQHAVAGAEKFMGHRKRQEAMDKATALREMGEGQNQKLLAAGLNKQLNQQQMTAEAMRKMEEERRRQMLMYGGWGTGRASA